MPSIIILALVVIGFLAGRFSHTWWAVPTQAAAAPTAPSRELADRDAFIEQLRELAWQHRDVSPELSTIIIDEIQTHHRRISRGPDA